jgi:hypothetical protein
MDTQALLQTARNALVALLEIADGVPVWHNAAHASQLGHAAIAKLDAALSLRDRLPEAARNVAEAAAMFTANQKQDE